MSGQMSCVQSLSKWHSWFRASCRSLDGGNGKDQLLAIGDDNRLFRGNGMDCLIAFGEGNLLDGDNGADRLVSASHGGFFGIGEGNVLTGGHGFDVFTLNNRSDLRVINDEDGDDHPTAVPDPAGAGW